MQTQNPFLDEMARLTNAAMGLAQSAGDEAKAAFRAQADRWVAELDLVRARRSLRPCGRGRRSP
jgi:BMFP domain-containing protein YqiC